MNSLQGLLYKIVLLNPLSANPTKWSNTLKKFVCNLPTNRLGVFDHFMNLALKGLSESCNCQKRESFVLSLMNIYFIHEISNSIASIPNP